MSDKFKMPSGAWAAIAALVILAGALSWRLMDNAGSSSDSVSADPAAMSTPQTLEGLRQAAQEAGDDAVSWAELGLGYFDSNMYAEAADAYQQAADFDPESSELWSALGEATVYASEDDPMPPAALEAFQRAIAIDSSNPRARYFLAVQKDLGGDHDGAIADWLALLADTPPGAPWETDLVRTITQVGQINQIDIQSRIEQALGTRNILPAPVASGIPGPTQEQMAAAATMSPGEQQNMAEGMVNRLAGRLADDPSNVEGWVMLMRSYQTLGRTGEAREAYQNALAANPQASPQLEAAAEALGI